MVGRTSMVPTAIRVAWIGNSLTDFHNLPSMFQSLSPPRVFCRSIRLGEPPR